MRVRLFRSRGDRVLGGVCGGLGSALGIDPFFFRLAFVLLTLGGGAGIPLYIILWVLTPMEGEGTFGSEETVRAGAAEIAAHARLSATSATVPSRQTAVVVGLLLVALGIGLLMRSMGMHWFAWLHLGMLWPALLIVCGLALLLRRSEGV